MNITFKDADGNERLVDETLNDLLVFQNAYSLSHQHANSQIDRLQNEQSALHVKVSTLENQISDMKSLILKIQEQQNDNNTSILGAIKNFFKFKKPSNITTSEVDLTKE